MSTHSRRRSAITGSAVVAVGFLTLAVAAPAFTASASSPQTMVRKSVQTLMDPDGTVQATRLYTQIQSTGDGNVTFTDQTSGSLRNLNGFGVPSASNGTVNWDFAVNGLNNQRTLQDYVKGDLPIKVKVDATLDGQPISANDVVGKSGLLKMTYTITNDTAVDQTITWKDGTGTEQTKSEKVPIPFVGSFSTTLSDAYADINAPGASMGGTGRNSTQLNYNLLLYKPLGDTTAVITYEARVTNADIPQVDMTFLPAGPAENASTKALQDQIKGGADTGVQLTDAGTQIDTNLLKLAAGAGDLNAGLAKLYAGSTTLADGLNNTAVPGATKLAAGATLVAAGNTTAASGGQQLATGTDTLATGAANLSDGVNLLSQGIAQLPAAVASTSDYKKLQGALTAVQAGIGKPTDMTKSTLLGGLNLIRGGLNNPACVFTSPQDPANPCGIKQVMQILELELDNSDPSSPGALQALSLVKAGSTSQAGAVTTLQTLLGCPTGATPPAPCTYVPDMTLVPTGPSSSAPRSVVVQQTLVAMAAGFAGTGPANPGIINALTAVIAKIGDTSTPDTAIYALQAVIDGIGSDATSGTLLNGTALIKGGLYNAPLPSFPYCDPNAIAGTANSCGVSQVQALVSYGIGQLVDGIAGLVGSAVGAAKPGCDPTATLACGAAAVSAGADQAATGSAALSSGLNKLSSGSSQVATGADQLATGLAPAASGASQIASGIGVHAVGCDPTKTLTCGGSAIQSGAQQLSDQGSKKLIAKGNDTANSYGEQYALMEALNARSATQAGIPNGPAKGTNVTTTGAFGYTLQGVTKADSTNWIRFLIAGLVLAASVGVGIAFARD